MKNEKSIEKVLYQVDKETLDKRFFYNVLITSGESAVSCFSEEVKGPLRPDPCPQDVHVWRKICWWRMFHDRKRMMPK